MTRAVGLIIAFGFACSSGDSNRKEPAPGIATERPTPAAVTTKPTVSLIGASVTVGFVFSKLLGGSSDNASFSIAELSEKLWGEGLVVHQRGDLFTFRDPFASGEKQVRAAISDGADLVIAVDFLFWYAHAKGAGQEERLARIERGLTLLSEIEAPIILGDIPNMRGADPRMLAASAVPTDETRDKINARLTEYAASRKGVTIFPLAEWMERVRSSGYTFALASGPFSASRHQLLQSDLLHASKLGMVAVADKLQPLVITALPSVAGQRRSIEEMLARLEVSLAPPVKERQAAP